MINRVSNFNTNKNQQSFGVAVKGPLDLAQKFSQCTGIRLFTMEDAGHMSISQGKNINLEDMYEFTSKNNDIYPMRSDFTNLVELEDGHSEYLKSLATNAVQLIPEKVAEIFSKYGLNPEKLAPVSQRKAALSELGITPDKYDAIIDLPFSAFN